MGTETDKFDNCLNALHAKQEANSYKYNLVDLETMTKEERLAYNKDARIGKLSEKSRAEITSQDLTDVTADEYATSRVWRAKDFPDMIFRSALSYYFHIEYHLKKVA